MQPSPFKVCPRCQVGNHPTAATCQQCGLPFGDPDRKTYLWLWVVFGGFICSALLFVIGQKAVAEVERRRLVRTTREWLASEDGLYAYLLESSPGRQRSLIAGTIVKVDQGRALYWGWVVESRYNPNGPPSDDLLVSSPHKATLADTGGRLLFSVDNQSCPASLDHRGHLTLEYPSFGPHPGTKLILSKIKEMPLTPDDLVSSSNDVRWAERFVDE